jgi:hypothetical protein
MLQKLIGTAGKQRSWTALRLMPPAMSLPRFPNSALNFSLQLTVASSENSCNSGGAIFSMRCCGDFSTDAALQLRSFGDRPAAPTACGMDRRAVPRSMVWRANLYSCFLTRHIECDIQDTA